MAWKFAGEFIWCSGGFARSAAPSKAVRTLLCNVMALRGTRTCSREGRSLCLVLSDVILCRIIALDALFANEMTGICLFVMHRPLLTSIIRSTANWKVMSFCPHARSYQMGKSTTVYFCRQTFHIRYKTRRLSLLALSHVSRKFFHCVASKEVCSFFFTLHIIMQHTLQPQKNDKQTLRKKTKYVQPNLKKGQNMFSYCRALPDLIILCVSIKYISPKLCI